MQWPDEGVARGALILTCPRSGSSMVAGLFHLHGCWVGTCTPADGRNPKGYFENVALKRHLKRTFGSLALSRRGATPDAENIRRIMAEDGYDGGPWVFKTAAHYAPAFSGLDFVPVKVRRPTEDIIASNMRSGMVGHRDPIETAEVVRDHVAALAAVGGAEIWTPRLVAGDHGELREALSHVGLTYDRAMTCEFVDGRLFT